MKCETAWEKAERDARIEHMAFLIFRGAKSEDVLLEFKASRNDMEAARHRAKRMAGKRVSVPND